MGYLLILVLGIIGGISTICRKNYTQNTIDIKNSLNIYMLLAHPIAAIYFFIIAKGQVPLNTPTFIFSALYALVCTASVGFSLLAYNRINLIYISVFSGAGTVVIPFVFDLLRGEVFNEFKLLSVILRFFAVLVPLLFNKSKNRSLIICIILFFVSGAANIIPKLYGEHPGVASDSSFCFWTNIIILPIVFFLILKQDETRYIFRDFRLIKPVNYFHICFGTLISNVVSLGTIYILRLISPTVYSVLSSSTGILITALISVLIYKEQLTKQALVSLVLSIAAILLGVL